MKKFLKSYFITALIVIVFTGYPFWRFAPESVHPGILYNFLVFFGAVLISGILILNAYQNRKASLFPMLTLSMFIKMTLGASYFILVFKQFSGTLVLFVFSFFLYYLVFTIFEVLFLIRFIKDNKEKSAKAG